MASEPTAIWDLMVRLRDESQQIFTDAGYPISRAYVAEGIVVHEDCEDTIAVQFVRSFRGSPAAENLTPSNCAQPRSLLAYIWVIRCSAQIQSDASVTDADMEAAAEQKLIDSWVLQSGLSYLAASEEWCNCDNFVVGESVLTGPQGGIGAVRQSVLLSIGPCTEGS